MKWEGEEERTTLAAAAAAAPVATCQTGEQPAQGEIETKVIRPRGQRRDAGLRGHSCRDGRDGAARVTWEKWR